MTAVRLDCFTVVWRLGLRCGISRPAWRKGTPVKGTWFYHLHHRVVEGTWIKRHYGMDGRRIHGRQHILAGLPCWYSGIGVHVIEALKSRRYPPSGETYSEHILNQWIPCDISCYLALYYPGLLAVMTSLRQAALYMKITPHAAANAI